MVNHSFYALSIMSVNACFSSSLALRTSGACSTSTDSCISWRACYGSRRQLWPERIRFIFEKERSTFAVPIGSSSNFLAVGENAGNMATFSGKIASWISCSCVDRSIGSRRSIRHSLFMSCAGTFNSRATTRLNSE